MAPKTKTRHYADMSCKISGRQIEDVSSPSFENLDLPKSIYCVQFKKCRMRFLNGKTNDWRRMTKPQETSGRLYPNGQVLNHADIAEMFDKKSNSYEAAMQTTDTNLFVKTRAGYVMPFYEERDQIIEQKDGKWVQTYPQP